MMQQVFSFYHAPDFKEASDVREGFTSRGGSVALCMSRVVDGRFQPTVDQQHVETDLTNSWGKNDAFR